MLATPKEILFLYIVWPVWGGTPPAPCTHNSGLSYYTPHCAALIKGAFSCFQAPYFYNYTRQPWQQPYRQMSNRQCWLTDLLELENKTRGGIKSFQSPLCEQRAHQHFSEWYIVRSIGHQGVKSFCWLKNFRAIVPNACICVWSAHTVHTWYRDGSFYNEPCSARPGCVANVMHCYVFIRHSIPLAESYR